MGVCFTAQTLSDQNIAALLADPPRVWLVLAPEEPELYVEASGQAEPSGWLARLLGKKREGPPVIPQMTFSEHEGEDVDLDKSWDGINHCVKKILGSTACPNLFEDGVSVGKVDVGYGPALCLTSEQVAAISQAYAGISEAALLEQFVPTQMRKVYPGGLWNEDTPDVRGYLADNFAELKAFLAAASEHRLGILIQMT